MIRQWPPCIWRTSSRGGAEHFLLLACRDVSLTPKRIRWSACMYIFFYMTIYIYITIHFCITIHIHIPYAPWMVYLPTFGWVWGKCWYIFHIWSVWVHYIKYIHTYIKYYKVHIYIYICTWYGWIISFQIVKMQNDNDPLVHHHFSASWGGWSIPI